MLSGKLLGWFLAASIAVLPFTARASTRITLNVPQDFPSISAAVNSANADTNRNNYYVINLQPGTYTNDFPTVNRPMTIQVDPAKLGQTTLLQATIPLPNQKGIILNNSSLTVIGLSFTGAWIDNSLGGNAVGIRDQSTEPNARLAVWNSVFYGNQEGILTGYNQTQSVRIAYSKFINNGNPDPSWYQHGIYIGGVKQAQIDHSVFCGQLIGHEIKSRAQTTLVDSNRIYDGIASAADGCREGSSSYAIDTPNGGNTTITNNKVSQGPATQNSSIIAYGEEGLPYSANSLTVTGNAITNTASNAIGVFIPNCSMPVSISGNTWTGVQTTTAGGCPGP